MIDKGIPIRNIYHMLCYAWNHANLDEEVEYDWESMDNIDDLLSHMMVEGMDYLRRKGFFRSYRTEESELSRVRGRIDIVKTSMPCYQMKKRAHCIYDEYDMDNQFNRILVSTMLSMAKTAPRETSKKLNGLIPYFSKVSTIRIDSRSFDRLDYDRFNSSYHLLMNICELYWYDKMSTEKLGEKTFLSISDSVTLHRIFEKFLLNYYSKHYPGYRPESGKFDWILEEGSDSPAYIQKLIPDIIMTNKRTRTILIVDAKYYSETLTTKHDKESIRNAHVAQVYAYMHNYPDNQKYSMKGMLIYPEIKTVIEDFPLKDGPIFVRTINLNKDWKDIEDDLDSYIVVLD